MEVDDTTASTWFSPGGPAGGAGGGEGPPGGAVLVGGSTLLNKMHTTPHQDISHTTRGGAMNGQGLFSDIQVPYIVIIWVVALASSLFSIALCCLCSYLQKRAQRMRLRRNREEPSQDTKVSDSQQNQTPIKIANPLSCRDSCAICCEPYATGSVTQNDVIIGYIRPCGHYFHHACAWRWISARETCPLCRNPVDLRKAEMTGMTLTELETLLGVPNGTLRRDRGSKSEKSKAEGSKLKTISLTMTLPVVLPPSSSELNGTAPPTNSTSNSIMSSTATSSTATSNTATATSSTSTSSTATSSTATYSTSVAMPRVATSSSNTATSTSTSYGTSSTSNTTTSNAGTSTYRSSTAASTYHPTSARTSTSTPRTTDAVVHNNHS